MSRPPISLYYVRCGHRSGNFGDMFSRDIVEKLSGRAVDPSGEGPEDIARADMVACGSLAQNLPADFRGIVWGTGLMFERAEVRCENAEVTALRGKLTAARWPHRPEVPLGDPGLLVTTVRPRLKQSASPRWRLGIVPHYVDADDPALADYLKRNRDECIALDSCSPDLPERIADCEVILSSSLHGLVIADALGVPNLWVVFSEKVQGGSFKFRDYLSAYGVDDRIAYTLRYDTPVDEIQRQALGEWTWGDKVAGVAYDLESAFPEDIGPPEPVPILEPEPLPSDEAAEVEA